MKSDISAVKCFFWFSYPPLRARGSPVTKLRFGTGGAFLLGYPVVLGYLIAYGFVSELVFPDAGIDLNGTVWYWVDLHLMCEINSIPLKIEFGKFTRLRFRFFAPNLPIKNNYNIQLIKNTAESVAVWETFFSIF